MTTAARRGSVPQGLLVLIGASAVIGLLATFSADIGLQPYHLVLIYTVLFWTTQATSWNILSGFAGYFSFGQGAFLGVGAFTMAVVAGRNDVNYLLAIPAAGLLCGVLALAIGAISFRRSLRGEIFALLTLAVPFILASIALNTPSIDGGLGTTIPTPDFPDWVPSFQHLMVLLNLAVAMIAVGVALAVHRSRFGRGLAAVHDAEDAAEVVGVPTFRYKMLAIVLGGVLGGMSGAVFAMMQGYVEVPTIFILYIPLFVILICVAGGRRHWAGPVIGAALLVVLTEWFKVADLGNYRDIVLGALLVGLVVLAPDGLFGRLRAHPWISLGTFLVLFVALLLPGYYAELDALLYAMIATAVVATLAGLRPVQRLLRRASPVEAAPAASPAATAQAPPVRSETELAPPPPAPTGGRVLVSVHGVTKNFGGVRALEDVSFEVAEGEIVGLVGPNGSGKTTMVNLLSGAMQPSGGAIAIDGRAIRGLAPHRVAHSGVARTYQIPKPFASMNVRDNVAMAIMFGRTGASYAEASQRADRYLATVHLDQLAGALPESLNLHQRQLLEMARAIAAEPVVLILDETFAGLNPAEIDDAVAVIRRIHATGVSIIIVEHRLRVLQQLATRIVVLNRGVLIADGAPSTVLNDATVVSAYLGRQRA
jgi:ABC-type branched-subunit amino acid transport system ATPase component/ABC-type branched-subunit amino acid transport system permease subunit